MTASSNFSSRSQFAFLRGSQVLLLWGLLTIVWGAYVRISGSGDGCGEHWPLCQGRFVPDIFSGGILETWIEYIHRAKSAVFGLGSLALYGFSLRIFPKGSPVRKAALFVLIFTVIEALLGAGLVVLRLVDSDQSYTRMFVLSIHLINTLALMGSIVSVEAAVLHGQLQPMKNRNVSLIGALLLLLAITGAWSSLSSTLSPSLSLAAGITQDLSAQTPLIFKLRVIHPLIAVLIGGIILYLLSDISIDTDSFKIALILQIFLGLFTLLLLSPTPLKLMHLLNAEIAWVFYQRIFWRIAGQTGGGPSPE